LIKKTKEKPLIIIINKTKGYNYSSGIERVRSKDLIGRWIDFNTNNAYFLTLKEQQELISKFASFTWEKDPYLKIQELEKQIELLENNKSKKHYHE